jgi:hypothetical protein
MSAYPPLTSVREVEVHGFPLATGLRWGCMAWTKDERLTDVQYDWRCLHCVEAAEARIAQLGDETQWWVHRPGDVPQVVTLSWLVTRARVIEDETSAALDYDRL